MLYPYASRFTFIFTLLLTFSFSSNAQIDEDKLGSWYMYFWNTSFGNSPFGMQGDLQYRSWNLGSDMEQLMLRGGFTYSPTNADIKFTQGYAHIRSGEYGQSSSTSGEHRIYQEALIPHKVGTRFFLTHRFRFEQRFVEGQDFRSRWRYNFFINVPLNNTNIEQGTLYLAFYNELFINGERSIGDGRSVEIFDRNRTYGALGYAIDDPLKVQIGMMRQTTNSWAKNQLQVSLHHRF